jgi:hypothetical protein
MNQSRAKTIKNVVVVNEELTAEEWKRRYERERDKVNRLRQQLQSMEAEMRRWRAGDKVPESEWASMVADLSANMQQSDNSELRFTDREVFLAILRFSV